MIMILLRVQNPMRHYPFGVSRSPPLLAVRLAFLFLVSACLDASTHSLPLTAPAYVHYRICEKMNLK